MREIADYAVGRGRPPLATRFQKGNTAARGRRQGREKSFVTLLLEALAEPAVDGAAGRRRKRLAKRELGLRRLADRVADGDPQAIKLVVGVVLALERRAPAEPAEQPSWAPADKSVIENLRELLRAS
jgi:Family of unknown function (DUF5681)